MRNGEDSKVPRQFIPLPWVRLLNNETPGSEIPNMIGSEVSEGQLIAGNLRTAKEGKRVY